MVASERPLGGIVLRCSAGGECRVSKRGTQVCEKDSTSRGGEEALRFGQKEDEKSRTNASRIFRENASGDRLERQEGEARGQESMVLQMVQCHPPSLWRGGTQQIQASLILRRLP